MLHYREQNATHESKPEAKKCWGEEKRGEKERRKGGKERRKGKEEETGEGRWGGGTHSAEEKTTTPMENTNTIMPSGMML